MATQCERDTLLLKAISIMLFILICMYVIVPLIELFTEPDAKEKPFPYKMIFPYNANNGILYVITYILKSLAGFGVVTTLFAEDSLFGFFVAYTCGQFKLLHRDINAIMKRGQMNAIKRAAKNIDNLGQIRESDIQLEYKYLLMDVIRKHNTLIK